MPGVLQLFAIVAFSLLACHDLHIMSSCAFLLHTCSSHASELFPRCPFCNPALLCHSVPLSTSFCVRVLNVFGLDRDLSCGLGLLPAECLSTFVAFEARLTAQPPSAAAPLSVYSSDVFSLRKPVPDCPLFSSHSPPRSSLPLLMSGTALSQSEGQETPLLTLILAPFPV